MEGSSRMMILPVAPSYRQMGRLALGAFLPSDAPSFLSRALQAHGGDIDAGLDERLVVSRQAPR